MTDFVKVAGHDGLVRDTRTKAIVNTNRVDYQNYITQRDARMKQQTLLEKHEEELNNIRNDLSDIKILLTQFLQKQS